MSKFMLCVVVALAALTAAGSGAADFGAPVTYPLPQQAKSVAVADFNSDGRDDVAVACWPGGLYVFLQTADGLLAPSAQLYSPSLPSAIAAGDINADGRADIAVGGAGGTICVYLQQPDGAFGLPVVASGYGRVNSIAIDDLNGDGLADIADTSADFPAVLVSLQTPGGGFDLPAVFPLDGWNARNIRTLDWNSDGARDIALLVDNTISVLLGTPDGFATPICLPALWPYALAAGDVTGDGLDDLVFSNATNQPDSAIGVFAQGGAGTPVLYPAYDYAEPIALADLNNDGRIDVATAHGGYEAASVLYQTPDGQLGPWQWFSAPYATSYDCGALGVGDLNSDGQPDLALVDDYNGLSIFLHEPKPAALDITAPACSASVSGTQSNNGWYQFEATVTVIAEDNVDGSGIKGVSYSLDGLTWLPYTAPIVIKTRGRTIVSYFAEDNAGNRSLTQSIEFRVDTTPRIKPVKPRSK